MNHHLQPTDWAYLAGFIDGEGCIGSYKSGGRWYPRLSIAQADQVMLLELYEKFDVGRYSLRRPTERNKATGWGATWNVRVAVQLKWLLEGVLPYLTLKKSQAEIALQLLEDHKDEALVVELRELKMPRRPESR